MKGGVTKRIPLLLVMSIALGYGGAPASAAGAPQCDRQHPHACQRAIAYWKHRASEADAHVAWQRAQRAHDAEQRILDARRGGSWPGYPIATLMVAAHAVHADYLAPQMLRVGRCESFPIEQQNHGGSHYFGWFQLGGHFLDDPLIQLLGWRSDIAQSLVVATWARTHGWGSWSASGACHHLS